MVKFADMTQEEQRAAVVKFIEQKENRQANSKVKNDARNALQKQYAAEYKALYNAALKRVKAVKLTQTETDKILATAIERKRKSQSKAEARKSLLAAHKAEYDKMRGKD